MRFVEAHYVDVKQQEGNKMKMNEYALTKIGNDYDQWNLYNDSEKGGGKFIAMINGKDNALMILNLLNGESNYEN